MSPNTLTAAFPFDLLGIGVHRAAAAIYDVAACRRVLDDAFPENVVLQHDMLEGFIARTADLPLATVVQPRTSRYVTRLRRGHRWLRGKFQALRWVLPRTRDVHRRLRPNPLSRTERFCIAELALIELATPASVGLLVVGWMVLPVSPVWWTMVVCPPITTFLSALVGRAATQLRRIRSGTHAQPPRSTNSLGVESFAMAFGVAVLAIESVMVLDAFVRAMWRTAVSKRRLLDWVPHRRVEAEASRQEQVYWREFLPAVVCSIAVFATLLTGAATAWPVAAPIVLLWIVSPAIVRYADRFVFDVA